MSNLTYETEGLPRTCGVEVIFDFHEEDGYGRHIEDLNIGGIGYAVAGFIDRAYCKQAYEELTQRFHLEYQSPVKMNHNSGNPFFFCIFRNK